MSSCQGRKYSKDPKTARVFVIDDVPSCDKLLQFLRSKYAFKMNYIGIDCEWVNKEGQMSVPVALLQIATPLCDCFLVRLCKMGGQMPQTVKEILEDKTVLKFGVGIQNDVKRLWEMFAVHALGCVDLRHVVQRINLENGDQSDQKMSLDALAQRILGVRLDKSLIIRCSNWEAEKLSTAQIEYAMNDALVASHIFLWLVKENSKQNTDFGGLCLSEKNFRNVCNEDEETRNQSFSITREYHPDNNETGLILKQSGENVELCLTSQGATAGYNEHHDSPTSEFAENRNLNQESKYQENENTKITCERSAVKGECDNLRPDPQSRDKVFQDLANGFGYSETVDLSKFECDEIKGYLSRDEVSHLISHPCFTERAGSLCQGVIDTTFKERKKKVSLNKTDSNSFSPEKSHYPSRNGTTRKSPLNITSMLAEPDGPCSQNGDLTNLDPYTAQPGYEPAGRPGSESYCLNSDVNVCVVCGGRGRYGMKSVIPRDYRRHFPPEIRDHQSQDFLMTCPKCRNLASDHDEQLREELAKKYNAPFGSAPVSHLMQDPKLKKVKAAAKALRDAGNKIPEKRRQELSLIVKNHFSAPALTSEMISQAATMETRKENANFVSHGFLVVKRVYEEGKLFEFLKMWRKHFVDTMRPQYLPHFWSVDHGLEGLKGKDCSCTLV